MAKRLQNVATQDVGNEEQQLHLNGKPVRRLQRKRAHQIYRLEDGTRVSGCSGICKLGDSSEGLLDWYFRLGQDGTDPRKARDEAADIGAVGHFLIECYLSGCEPDLSEYSPYCVEIARLCFGKFLIWWEEGGYTACESELRMVSSLHRYGGTLDCVAYDKDMRKCLLDFKLSNYHSNAHGFQLAGYKNLYEETRGDKLERFCVVRIPKRDDAPADPRWYQTLEPQWRVFKAQLELNTALRALKK